LITKSNGDVGILIGSCELVVRAHSQYKIGQTAQNDWRSVGRPSSCNALQFRLLYSSFYLYF